VGNMFDRKWSRDLTHCQCLPDSSLLHDHHHATALRHVAGIEGMPGRYHKAYFSRRWLIGWLRAILSASTGAIKSSRGDATPSIPLLSTSLLLGSNSWWPWRQ
jgi:hypothetical protein